MKGSLIVVGFFLLGLLAGHSGTLPAWVTQCDISFVALCGLLLCVGIGIGMNPDMKSDIKSLSPRLALLPLVTILGSWLGAVVAFGVNVPDEKYGSLPLRGIGFAQDVGGAIKQRRIDLFCGGSERANYVASHLDAPGPAWVLVAR